MTTTDKSKKQPGSNNKYKSWVATIFIPENSGVTDLAMSLVVDEIAESYAFQREVTPTTGKDHFQVAFSTKDRKRQSTLVNELSSKLKIEKQFVTVDRMMGTFDEAVAYVTKEETRAEGSTPIVSSNVVEPYRGQDVEILNDPTKRYPWQASIADLLFEACPTSIKPASDRTVYWFTDQAGCSGKSLFTKYLCYYNTSIKKISFGTSNQLRSGVIDAGPAKMYIVDIPRTLGKEDHLNNIITVIEDLKSGFVVSNFHGKSRQLMIMPPHIVVFANFTPPYEKLSGDRWVVKEILSNKELVDAWL